MRRETQNSGCVSGYRFPLIPYTLRGQSFCESNRCVSGGLGGSGRGLDGKGDEERLVEMGMRAFFGVLSRKFLVMIPELYPPIPPH